MSSPSSDPSQQVRYVRRRDRVASQLSGLSRKERRRLLNVSQTYWAAEQDQTTGEAERFQRMHWFREFGDFAIAYSTAVQPLLQYHQCNSVHGYLAFRRRWGVAFVLGDPIAASQDHEQLIRSFCDQHQRIAFCQVSKPTANILSGMRFCVNQMGTDTVLDLENYDFCGKEKEWLRYADNWTKRRGYTVREASFEEVNAEAIETVSEAWRNTRTIKRKEVRFLNRPIVVAVPEPEVRKFYFYDSDERLLAFVYFDPIYRDGNVVGYVTSFKRRHPEAPLYAEQAIMKNAIAKLKSEGIAEIRLGLSPAAWLGEEPFQHDAFTARLLNWVFESEWINRRYYNLVGHANYKRRFRGREEPVYYASNSRFSVRRLAALVGLCGIA